MHLRHLLLLIAAACGGETARESVPVEQPAAAIPAPLPEAPPPAPRLAVGPRAVLLDAIGDTVRLVLPGAAACRSAAPAVATVDDLGLVRAVANGATLLHCRDGEAAASVRVTVAQAIARISITSEGGFDIPKAGESLQLDLARVDRLGAPVSTAPARWASLQPEVVRIDAVSGIALGMVDSGAARVVARVDGFADTVTVELGRKPTTIPLLSQSARTSTSRAARLAALRRMTTPSARRGPAGPVADRRFLGNMVGVRDVQAGDSLDFQDPGAALLARRARTVVPYAVAVLADHGVNEQGVLERSSGVMFGVGAEIVTRGWFRAGVQVATGTLAAQTAASRDQTVTDGRVDLGIAAFPWLTLNAGVQSRVYKDISAVRWVMVRTGGDVHVNLGGTPLTGIASLNLLPVISRGDGNTAPNFGMNTGLGMGFERGRFNASLKYFVERYGFPAQAGAAARQEQFSGLEFRLGILFGW